eukprot:CAMPEP_0206217426 /NCGR_PEP_ID=MMETSP0047_2-20121206/3269_1 /ASSEMBLY_ACC=CAM_ASM_000192 /TAXON_ID=195065 /ORGANISM="Chroomonas mesostigmatica_cf, Strain CCMP1168" /LENGTH=682 /DNA_ID=CAMNT_0053639881 /DNA_START=103 /DNA_END=2147 /DNA_ORIENTATION=+
MMRIDYAPLHELADLLAHSPKCTTLDIQLNWVLPQGAIILAPALEVATQLTHLDLSFNDMRTQGAQAIAPALAGMLRLRTLMLGCNHMGDDGLRAVASSLVPLSRLETLDLSKNKISSAGVDALLPFLQEARFLKRFDFAGNVTHYSFHSSDGPEIMYKLGPLLMRLPCLETLNVASNYLFGLGTKYTGQIVTESSGSIKHLNVGGSKGIGNKIGMHGARSLAAALFHTPLVSLDSSFNELGAEGVSVISNAFTFQTCLATLSLRGNKMGLAGVRSLVQGLRMINCLQSLNLSENRLGSDSLEALCPCLQAHSGLTQLNLSGNALLALEETVGKAANHGGVTRFCVVMRNGGLPALARLDLRDTELDRQCSKLLVSALGQHTCLTALNALRAPSAKVTRWTVLHPLEHAELFFAAQRIAAQPKAFSLAILANWKRYVTVDLSGCALLRFPDELLALGSLEELNVAGSYFASMPYDRLIHSPTFQSLDVRGCRNLSHPPQAVAHRGGVATVQYMREAAEVRRSITLPLVLCGQHDEYAGRSPLAPALSATLARLLPVLQTPSKRLTTAALPKTAARRSMGTAASHAGSSPVEALASLVQKEGAYEAWKRGKREALGPEPPSQTPPEVWSSKADARFYFEPWDVAGPSLSQDCLGLFMPRKAVYVLVWDAEQEHTVAGALTHWL